MEEEIDNQNKPERSKPTDKVSPKETIASSEQNANFQQALSANPNKFHSMADLPALGARNIEAFQIVDGDKQIAASRKVDQAGSRSFHEGLQALPAAATEEQKAQYQIEYIMRKGQAPGLLLKTGLTETQQPPNSNKEYDPIIIALDKYVSEQKERAIGSLIGTVEGIGDVATSIAWVADFGAALILGDKERAGAMGAQFGESIGTAIVSGVRLFSAANDYLYDVGFEGDYSKPFKDISTVASALNAQWQSLPPGEQERLKSRLATELLVDGLIGSHGARHIGKASKYTECLELIAQNADHLTDQQKLKAVKVISGNIKEITDRSLKMIDLPSDARRPELSIAEPDLLKKMANNARRELEIVEPGSDMDKYMKFMNTVGIADGTKIFLKSGTSKIAAFEEFFHGTQFLQGWRGKIPDEILEVKVKDFMIRHSKWLGLEQGDVDYLKLLKEREFQRALERGYTPYEIEGKRWLD